MFGHRTVISGVAATSKFVVSAGYDNKVICWDHRSRDVVGVGYHDHFANSVAISASGKMAVTSGADFTARLWSIPDMQLLKVLSGHDDDIDSAQFCPNDRLIATASYDDSIGIFDLEGNMINRLWGHDGDVNTVFWNSPTTVVSTGDDATVRLWDVQKGEQLAIFDLGDVETDCVCAGPEDYILAGDDNGSIHVLNAGGLVTTVQAHNAGVKNLFFDRDKAEVVSAGYDGTLAFWTLDGTDLSLAQRIEFPDHVWPRSGGYISGSEYSFATFGSCYASLDRATQKWSAPHYRASVSINAVTEIDGGIATVGDDGVLRRDGEIVCKTGRLCNFVLPCGDDLVAGGQSGEVISGRTGKVVYKHRSPINGGGVSVKTPLGDRVFLGTYTGEVIVLCEGKTGPTLERVERLGDNSVKALAVSPTLGMAVLATGAAVFFDPVDLSILRTCEAHEAVANSCTISENGFASVGRDLKLILWDKSGNKISVVDTPHAHSIKYIFHEEGILYLADYRGSISVYDIDLGKFIEFKRICETALSSISSHPTETVVFSGYDGRLYNKDGVVLYDNT